MKLTEKMKSLKRKNRKRKIYLVRHGQTLFNEQGKIQGWKDSPLSQTGIDQAEKLKNMLEERNLHFEHVYASDLSRAIQTASILKDENSTLYASPGLREISFGVFDGKEAALMDGVDWQKEYEKYQGESFEQAVLRVYQTLLQILKSDPADPLLVISHGAVLEGIYQLLEKDESMPEFAQMFNCITFECEADENGFRLIDVFHP